MCRIEKELKKKLTAVDDIWYLSKNRWYFTKDDRKILCGALERTGHSRMKCSFVSSDSL